MSFKIATVNNLYTNGCNMDCEYCFEKEKGNKSIDFDKFKDYIVENQPRSLFGFGGEPLLYLDEIIDLKKFIKETPLLDDRKKRIYDVDLRNIITNGTLLKRNIKKIKENNMRVQVSLDGCRLAHNKHRKYPDGSGTYDDVIGGVMEAIQQGVPTHIHSVVTRETIPYINRTLKLLFHLSMLSDGIDKTIENMGGNVLFFIFEDEYTDRDIDLAIVQYYKFFKWINSRKFLHKADKKAIYEQMAGKKCSACNSGVALIGLDVDFNMYPCHRVMLSDYKEKMFLGSALDYKSLQNSHIRNSYFRVRHFYKLYSAVHNIDMTLYPDKESEDFFYMWCPSTNFEVSGCLYYQPEKYNVLVKELQRALEWIGKEFGWRD